MQRIAFISVLITLTGSLCASPGGSPTTRPTSTVDANSLISQPTLAARRLLEENAALRQEAATLRAEAEEARIPPLWMAIGFAGQFIFGLRFVVQWIATERRRRSVVPVAFWYLSLAGTVVLLTYSIYRLDPVFIAGFSLNMVIYLRNLYFIRAEARAREAAA
ncbi:MAG: lipid-A-disaccharide synthase N-terminal domain-containing protein [Planctomycetota bacterium]